MILNLVNPNDPLSIKYKISKFPDGQQSIQILEYPYITYDTLKYTTENIAISSRLNSFMDLEIILCATQALKEIGVKNISLHISYFLGGRSDRIFAEGGIHYIKHILAPIINS